MKVGPVGHEPARLAHTLEPARRSAYRALVEDALRAGRRVRLTTRGSSMRFLIPSGCELLVEGCAGATVRPGDVVLVRLPGGHRLPGPYLVHRVIRVRRTGGGRAVQTKGDSSPKDPCWFGPEQVLGRVVRVERADGPVDLTAPAWREVARPIAALSRLAGAFAGGLPGLGRRGPPGRPVLPQRLALSAIKRLTRRAAARSRVEAR